MNSEVSRFIVFEILLPALASIVTLLVGVVTARVVQFIKDKQATELAIKVVGAVEQMYHDLDGPEKFEKAKANLLVQLNSRGIKMTDDGLEMLIESVVSGYNIGRSNINDNEEEYVEVVE